MNSAQSKHLKVALLSAVCFLALQPLAIAQSAEKVKSHTVLMPGCDQPPTSIDYAPSNTWNFKAGRLGSDGNVIGAKYVRTDEFDGKTYLTIELVTGNLLLGKTDDETKEWLSSIPVKKTYELNLQSGMPPELKPGDSVDLQIQNRTKYVQSCTLYPGNNRPVSYFQKVSDTPIANSHPEDASFITSICKSRANSDLPHCILIHYDSGPSFGQHSEYVFADGTVILYDRTYITNTVARDLINPDRLASLKKSIAACGFEKSGIHIQAGIDHPQFVEQFLDYGAKHPTEYSERIKKRAHGPTGKEYIMNGKSEAIVVRKDFLPCSDRVNDEKAPEEQALSVVLQTLAKLRQNLLASDKKRSIAFENH